MIFVLRAIAGTIPATYPLPVIALVPLRGFDSAKTRLESALSAGVRSRLAAAVAGRVVSACREAGWRVTVVSSAADVSTWCQQEGIERLPDPGGGLDAAALAAVAAAGDDPWSLVHGDLPLLTAGDLAGIPGRVASGQVVLAPSRDGGTNLIAATGPFRFAYGPGSFARHVARAGRPIGVLVRPGLAVELDTPSDLASVRLHPDGRWVERFLS